MEYLLAIVFFVAAFICLAVEVFIIPGFGFIGVLGLVLLAGAIGYTWINLGAGWGIGMLLLSFLLFGVGVWVFAKTRFGKRFVLKTSQKGAVSSLGHDHADLVGKQGKAVSNLHPSGTAMFDGKKVDVVTGGVYIAKGAAVAVVETSGPRVVVKEVKQ
ncbi:MAG: NfeD family protein [Pseudomonadota bacterium]